MSEPDPEIPQVRHLKPQTLPGDFGMEITPLGSPVQVRISVEDWRARGRDAHFIYLKTIPMFFLPHAGEEIEIDSEMGLEMTVRHRWWDVNGLSVLDLYKVYIDPPEHVHRNLSPAKGVTFWWTDRDGGDLHQILTRNGWETD